MRTNEPGILLVDLTEAEAQGAREWMSKITLSSLPSDRATMQGIYKIFQALDKDEILTTKTLGQAE